MWSGKRSPKLQITLMMEAVSTPETSVNFCGLHGATTQKAAIFILAAGRTENLAQ
jgi:hypothetical protein